MNQEIQMVTSKTILQALELTPNLIEFLASEKHPGRFGRACIELFVQ